MNNIKCKYCDSVNIIKYGYYKNIQNYFCNSCHRKFKINDNLFHSKVPAKYIIDALDMYCRGLFVSDIQYYLKKNYNYWPSKAIVYRWVTKYIRLAKTFFDEYHPVVSDMWIVDETLVDITSLHRVYVYDVIDHSTRFFLATHLTTERTVDAIRILFKQSFKRAGKMPKEIVIDKTCLIGDILHEIRADTDILIRQRQNVTQHNIEVIERFSVSLENNTKVIRLFRNENIFSEFLNAWMIYYNFLRIHESLAGITPAEKSEITYKIKNWGDFIFSLPTPSLQTRSIVSFKS